MRARTYSPLPWTLNTSLFRPLHHRTLLSHSSRHLLRLQHPFYLKMSLHDYPNIQTPASCYVDFCLVPVGTGNVSVANEVAEVQRLLKASGLKHTMHSAGTTVEGPWDEVMKVIGQAHAVVHQEGAKRVQTSMRAGTRTDKKQTAEDKVKKVEGMLSKD